jgi:hypothetical protein
MRHDRLSRLSKGLDRELPARCSSCHGVWTRRSAASVYPAVKRIADRRRHIIFHFSRDAGCLALAAATSRNVAAAIALAATDERAARRIYNAREESSFSELEWARKIAAGFGRVLGSVILLVILIS